ncbi:MAG: HD domain-containing protein [Gammaproteobacteria bacterium]|nr:HD domain-containing protein [Gammaproteobacteria bacterium]
MDHPADERLLTIDLRHAILMVARTLDFVGIDDLNHGHRVAYIAYKCARVLGWSEARCQFAYFAGLLHDCGVSSSREHLRLIANLQPEDSEAHCLRGERALMACPVLSHFATVVRYHHSAWTELLQLPLGDEERLMCGLIFLADRVDFLRARYLGESHQDLITLHEGLIAENILAHRGTLFAPELVDTMAHLVSLDGFWYAMDAASIEAIGQQFRDDYFGRRRLRVAEVTQLARLLAHIVDAKSPFTFEHSEKVALLSRVLAADLGLSLCQQQQIEIAGLLHDIGKLRTADEILHKGTALTDEEYSHIKRHTVDTEQILRGLFADSPIAGWAANHHERLDGSGYPYRKTAAELDLPSRIVAMADIFQALVQNRPYRGRLPVGEVLEIIAGQVDDGRLDGEVFAILSGDIDRYYLMAINDDKGSNH